MRVDKKQIVKDFQFCKELMDRLLKDATKYGDTPSIADIIRLRRELNEIRKKMDIWS